MLNQETTYRSIVGATRNVTSASHTQRVVIVNGSLEILELIETILKAGHYDVVFVESNQHAYSQIKRVQPTWSPLRPHRQPRWFSSVVDAQARRGNARHSRADLHDWSSVRMLNGMSMTEPTFSRHGSWSDELAEALCPATALR